MLDVDQKQASDAALPVRAGSKKKCCEKFTRGKLCSETLFRKDNLL